MTTINDPAFYFIVPFLMQECDHTICSVDITKEQTDAWVESKGGFENVWIVLNNLQKRFPHESNISWRLLYDEYERRQNL